MNYKHVFLAIIVVVALLVIFKPLLYQAVAPKPTKGADPIAIPEKSSATIIMDKSNIKKKIPHTADPLAYTNDKQQQNETISKPDLKKVEKVPTEKAYVLQLASFQDETKAKNLVSQLRDKGFNAFSQQSKQGYRVFIGPVLGEKALTAVKDKVEKETTFKPVSKEYSPLKGGTND